MIRKIIFTLCFLLLSTVVWSENKVELDAKTILEMLEMLKDYPPDPDIIKRLVGNWSDKDGNSVKFDSEGNCLMKRVNDSDLVTNTEFNSWKLYQNIQGRHYIDYFRQNGCRPIMRRFYISFADDDQTLILKSVDNIHLHLTKQTTDVIKRK